jgi:DNA-directed RNA polymerase subunit RPC12/RpoP
MDLAKAAAVLSVSLASITWAADYMPLKEGNQWTYTMSTGVQMTTKVVGFRNVGTVRCGVVETGMGAQTSREYLAADAQGVKLYMSQMQGQEFRCDPPVLRIKLPYRQGDAWQSTTSQFGTTMSTKFQSGGNERIQTPAGSFDCIKVQSTITIPGQPPINSTTWYADGIGPVHQTMEIGGQELTATLTATTVRPAPKTQTAPQVQTQTQTQTQTPAEARCPKCGAKVSAGAKFCPECGTKLEPPKPVVPTVCPKCGVKLPAGAKFCPSCGEKIVAAPAAAATPTTTVTTPIATDEPVAQAAVPESNQPALEKYQSPDGKVLLYKPGDWTVTEGELFGPGIYSLSVAEPQDNAAVLFMTFPVDEAIKDSVVLAARCTEALKEEFPDLAVTNMSSTKERERTVADLSLTADGEKGTGHAYFFRTEKVGTVYFLLAKTALWAELRPTLISVAANLAYAPEGVAAVQEEGRKLAEEAPAAPTDGRTLSPAAMLQQAAKRQGKQVPLQQASLQDQSMSIQIPQGWALVGGKLQFVAQDSPETKAHGFGYVCHTIIPMDMQVQGAITVGYQPPAQALRTVLAFGKLTTDLEVLAEMPVETAVPELAQAIQQQRAQGFQVDARLLHVRFTNMLTGRSTRGLYIVTCSMRSLTPVWQVSVNGSWAPEDEFDEWLPVYLRAGNTAKVNEQWLGQEMQNRAVAQQQGFRNLQNSIAESNKAFDSYMDSLRDAGRSRDYISHMWSETTLGQGSWVAENEGAKVYHTDSWGIEGPEGRIDAAAYNTTNFTGQNPWSGRDMEMIDTRAEYERYIANQ